MNKSLYKTPNTLSAIYITGRAAVLPKPNRLYELAFNSSLQSNIITLTNNAEIIAANMAACKLLGYSPAELLLKNKGDIFLINDCNFKKMLKLRKTKGQSTAFLTAIKKNGTPFPCLVTSAVFKDADGTEKAITSLMDLSLSILKQKSIDTGKEKIVADNILLARSRQRRIDTQKGKIVAGNIIMAQSRSDTEKFRYQELSEEKIIHAIKLKEKQIAEAMEDAKDTARSDIGKELHDNINQLLGASRIYIEMAKRGGPNTKIYLGRSSEYTLTAIEEIRKLTKGLTTDTIINLGLAEAIENIAATTMEINPAKISCVLNSFIENSVDKKFKLNIYRIIQEQLNNIVKHANAEKVIISLSQISGSIVLCITDNGVGFDINKKQKGIGVDNIKSRAAHYKGTAVFISQPGRGCTLHVNFPYTKTVSARH